MLVEIPDLDVIFGLILAFIGGLFTLFVYSKLKSISASNEQTKQDIQTQLKRVSDFAKLQKEHIKDFECVDDVGVTYGQRVIPVDCVGCYVPGGRYSRSGAHTSGLRSPPRAPASS